MTEWISVKDSLPNEGERVLVHLRNNYIEVGYYEQSRYANDYEGFQLPYGCIGISEITHWQPLPEPPEGD